MISARVNAMTRKFIQFDDFIINYDENIIGFIKKDIYLEIDPFGVAMFQQIQNSKRLYTMEELMDLFVEVDIEELIYQLQDFEVVSFVENNNVTSPKGRIKEQGNKYINFVYVVSAVMFLYNIYFLSKHLHKVFVLDFKYLESPITLFIVMFFLEILLAFFHELGHYTSAKIVGVNSTLRVSQRFIFFLVFECKMNGVWLLDKYKRIFPMIGGIIVDNFVIWLCSILIGISPKTFQILFVILFIQYTKMLYHLLIPFKTDLYYLLLFRFHNYKYEKAILRTSYVVGYFLLIPLLIIYSIQFINLFIHMKSSPLIQNILVILILVLYTNIH